MCDKTRLSVIQKVVLEYPKDIYALDHFTAFNGQYELHLCTPDKASSSEDTTVSIEVEGEVVAEWRRTAASPNAPPTNQQKSSLKYTTEAVLEKALREEMEREIIERQTLRLQCLIDINKLFYDSANKNRAYILRQAVRLVMKAVDADTGMIAFADEKAGQLKFEIYEVKGGGKEWESRAKDSPRPANAESHIGGVFVSQEFAYIPNMKKEDCIARPIHESSIASITVPLTGPTTKFGALACDSFTEDGFTQADIEAFRGFGRLIGLFLELEQAETEKVNALAELTHQLVSQVNALRMNSVRLRSDMPPNRIESIARTLDATCELMATTVFNVRSLKSLLDDDNLTVQPTRQLIYRLLKRAETLFQPLASDKNIEIWVERSVEVYAYFEPERFAHAFNNIVDNAVKYSVADSKIIISVDNADIDYCTICVSNRGVPIETDELKKIFEKGYRAERAKQSGIQGTGFGLALARKIVELHKGEIWATSRKRGDGTADISFYIKLPKTVRANTPLLELLKKGGNR